MGDDILGADRLPQLPQLPQLEPVRERVNLPSLPDRDERLHFWLAEYEPGYAASESNLGLRAAWASACRKLALARIGSLPTWRRTNKGELITGPNPRVSVKPEDRIWPAMWQWSPTGSSLYVMRIPPDDTSKGGIIIPESAKASNHKGWILNVSPDLDCDGPPLPCDNPLDLIGQTANWGHYAGRALAETALDERWDGEYLQLSWGEVLGLELLPPR